MTLIGLAEQAVKGHLDRRAARDRGASRAAPEADGAAARHGRSVARTSSSELSAMIDELAHLAEALATLGDMTPRSLAAISAYGEQHVVAPVRGDISRSAEFPPSTSTPAT